MGLYYNGKKVRNLYYNGKCITELALGKEMTRLVEGDDFVTAEWLCGRNGAYIDTNYNIKAGIDTFDVHFKYDGTTWNPEGLEQNIFGCIDNDNYLVRTYINHLNFIAAHYFKLQKTYPYFEQATDADIQFLRIEDAEHFAYSFNGNEHIVPYTWMGNKTLTSTCYLFNVNHQPYGGNIGRYFHGDIAYFRITDPTLSTDRVNMFPCRLLRPIPATLDGNGIARNAGDCGMFDAVSGKFFGNVASGGTFTVEPSLVEGVDYERHRWLVGDGSAYIDTLINKLKGTITVDIDRTAVTSNSNILGREAYPGLGYESRCVVNLLRQNNNYIADIYGIRTTFGYGVHIDSVDTLYLDLDTKIASTKSGNSTSIDIGTDIGGYNMLLFAKNNGSTPSYCWRGGIGEFKMADVISLTPVRLLRPLPSYLDANGKARSQFECGMLDLKTMKFYGNVASSGSFTISDN